MILNRLTLVNFGVYHGEHSFDLRPREGGPIVILGGKNGAGKTTVLEAIRLALHGPLALDGYPSRAAKRSDYRQSIPDTALRVGGCGRTGIILGKRRGDRHGKCHQGQKNRD